MEPRGYGSKAPVSTLNIPKLEQNNNTFQALAYCGLSFRNLRFLQRATAPTGNSDAPWFLYMKGLRLPQ